MISLGTRKIIVKEFLDMNEINSKNKIQKGITDDFLFIKCKYSLE